MRMSFHLLEIILLSFAAVSHLKEHYHRYMLSDYRPQHNPRTQMDYKHHRPPVYPADRLRRLTGTKGPLISLRDTKKRVHLDQLIVRIYKNHVFSCIGTLITDILIITAGSCFIKEEPGKLTIKTSLSNEFLDVTISNTTESFVGNEKSLIIVLALDAPTNSKEGSFKVKLCDDTLELKSKVELITYRRRRHNIHTQETEVMDLDQCRDRMEDSVGKPITENMICVRNSKGTGKCQPTQGNPLIQNGRICGINLMGHDCPQPFGVDIFASVYSADDYVKKRYDALQKSKIDEFIF